MNQYEKAVKNLYPKAVSYKIESNLEQALYIIKFGKSWFSKPFKNKLFHNSDEAWKSEYKEIKECLKIPEIDKQNEQTISDLKAQMKAILFRKRPMFLSYFECYSADTQRRFRIKLTQSLMTLLKDEIKRLEGN